ncbi:MAG TPA: TetR/AcrR family transcriptional regulator [Jiangellaceae bacterium]|jgi:AcrR family transcriptional regulator|nr:TetR/AcrR family transcriptional regulator [Jiangellaceae bacterium]
MSADPTPGDSAERVVRAAVELLAAEGPSAIKARTVASASGLSTMAVYHHFGGIPELLRAVIDHGYQELDRAFAQLPVTDDPIADLFTMALTTRDLAGKNPHLYDLMFGLSTRASYRPAADVPPSGRSPEFRAAYQHLIGACDRLVRSGRVGPADPDVVAAALWSFVHGYITLELAQHFVGFDDPVREVLLPTGVTFSIGLGDTRELAQASHDDVLRRRATSSKGRRRKATTAARG